MSSWRLTTLREIGRIFDGPHATPTRQDVGPYFLNISSLSNGRLDLCASDHVSDDDFAKWTKRVTPRTDDLLFSYETRLGEAALMPDGIRACLGRRMALIRPDLNSVHPRFLLYLYLSPQFQSTIERNTIHGATVNRIPLNRMGDWPVNIPPLREQREIAEVLGAFDDKIAANAALIASADQLMNQTFRSTPMSDAIPLSSTADFVNGKAFTKDASGTGRVVVRIAELNAGISGSTVFSDASVDDKHVARPGDILFAWSGSLALRRWFRDDAIVNQHIFKVIPRDGFPAWLSYALVDQKLEFFKGIAADKATTMGHIQRHHLDEVVQIPSTETVAQLDPLMSGLWSTALNAEQESLSLAAARDALLPQLMSGKLKVRDVEAVASAAGV